MRLDIHQHIHFEGELLVTNPALETELSALESVLAEKDSTIASLSTALSDAGSVDVSSAVSTAVDAEDTAIADSISSILSAG